MTDPICRECNREPCVCAEAPRSSMYADWLREKAGVMHFAAYRGDLLSIANALDTLHAERDALTQRAERAERDCARALLQLDDALGRLQTLQDALDAAAGRVSGWQPIATAPRGAKGQAWMRLAWGEGEDQYTGDGYRQDDKFYACAWFYQLGQPKKFASRDIEVQPTHWQPHDGPPTDVLAAAQEGS